MAAFETGIQGMAKTPEVVYKETEMGVENVGNIEKLGTTTDQMDMARMGKQQELKARDPFESDLVLYKSTTDGGISATSASFPSSGSHAYS